MAFENDGALGYVAASQVATGHALSDGLRARILLADDDDNVRGLLTRLLELQGWDVVAVRNGREAVEAWPEEATPFDLVILDMNMPVMSGPAAYEELRRQHRDMVVLFVSGYLEEASWRELILKGKVPFLSKPFAPQQLIATATALLAHGRQRVEPRGAQRERSLVHAMASGVV